MTCSAPRLAKTLSAVAIAVVALVAAPRSAWASCGEYLQMAAHGGGHAFDARPASSQPTSSQPGRPCRGPHCSARQPSPQTPLTPPLGSGFSLEGLVPAMPELVCEQDERPQFALKTELPALLGTGRLFRPPRLG